VDIAFHEGLFLAPAHPELVVFENTDYFI